MIKEDKLGYRVLAFEPSTVNYEHLKTNLQKNICNNVIPHKKAISDHTGFVEFISVTGNLTASHISGSREYHGNVKKEKVETIAFRDLNVRPDFLKIDVEGHESVVIKSINYDDWENIDAIVEIHSETNAKEIFDYFYITENLKRNNAIKIFSHKTLWREVINVEDMPKNNKEGNILITSKNKINWD